MSLRSHRPFDGRRARSTAQDGPGRIRIALAIGRCERLRTLAAQAGLAPGPDRSASEVSLQLRTNRRPPVAPREEKPSTVGRDGERGWACIGPDGGRPADEHTGEAARRGGLAAGVEAEGARRAGRTSPVGPTIVPTSAREASGRRPRRTDVRPPPRVAHLGRPPGGLEWVAPPSVVGPIEADPSSRRPTLAHGVAFP